jgi:colicin import membrane protein
MAQRQRPVIQGRWRAIALSLLVHSCIVAAAVLGWFTYKHKPPPVTTLAIEATVVDERAVKVPVPSAAPEPAPPEPEPQPVEEQGPPKPDPAEVERKQEEERLAQEKLEQEKLEQQKLEEQETLEEQKKAQEQERLDAEKKEAEKQAAAKAAAEKAAADKAAADKRAAEKKKAEDAAAAKKAAEEKARVAREAELRRSLEAEERGNAIRNSDEAARWHASIVAKIQRAWIKPASARPGVTCIVSVSQVLGGEVTAVRVNSCSIDDAALRQSVENAVYSASPLPPPPDPALFERNLELTFAPQ